MDKNMEKLHPIAKLAKDTVETYIISGKVLKPENLNEEMKERAGVFVSIHKKGALRGCIGTFEPTQDNVANEIIHNAIQSATGDPRFSRVRPIELPDLDYSVDVLTSPVPAPDISKLDPRKQGIIVQSGWRRGLLLPDLEGVDTVDQQIDICMMKAGIHRGEPIEVFSFEVRRFK
jgi:AmmeMemoRadiSam system protein A